MHRLRITFARGEKIKYVAHLDLMRLWHRTLRRAEVPIVYSQGFSPRPRLSMAAPLAVGVTSEGELMDLFLTKRMAPFFLIKAVSPQLPQGLEILEAEEVSLDLPSLQSMLHFAEYRAGVGREKSRDEVTKAMDSLLALTHLPWQHVRDTEVRRYDLRALVDDLWLVEEGEEEMVLGMRLHAGEKGTGRPEQVAAALGFSAAPKYIHRTRLILSSLKKPKGVQ